MSFLVKMLIHISIRFVYKVIFQLLGEQWDPVNKFWYESDVISNDQQKKFRSIKYQNTAINVNLKTLAQTQHSRRMSYNYTQTQAANDFLISALTNLRSMPNAMLIGVRYTQCIPWLMFSVKIASHYINFFSDSVWQKT